MPSEGPPAREHVVAELDVSRAALRALCSGLSADRLARRPWDDRGLSLLGVIRQATNGERSRLRCGCAGERLRLRYDAEQLEDVRADWADADLAAYDVEVSRARGAVASLPFELAVEVDRTAWTVRELHVRLIEQYAGWLVQAGQLRAAVAPALAVVPVIAAPVAAQEREQAR